MRTKGKVMGAAAIGLTAGALGALLMAPKSGQEIRSDIKHRAATLKDKTKLRAKMAKLDVQHGFRSAKSKMKEAANANRRRSSRHYTEL